MVSSASNSGSSAFMASITPLNSPSICSSVSPGVYLRSTRISQLSGTLLWATKPTHLLMENLDFITVSVPGRWYSLLFTSSASSWRRVTSLAALTTAFTPCSRRAVWADLPLTVMVHPLEPLAAIPICSPEPPWA